MKLITKIKQNNGLTARASWYTFANLLIRGVAFITAPIFTRLLLPSEYGLVSVYLSWVTMLSIFVGMQTNGSIANAKVELKDNEYNAYLSNAMFIGFASFCAVLLAVCLFKTQIAKMIDFPESIVILMVFHSFGTFAIGFYSAYLNIEKKTFRYVILSFINVFATVGLAVFLVITMESDKYIGKIIGNAVPVIILGAVITTYIFLKGKDFFNKKYWKFCLALATPLIFHALSGLILAQSDRVMIRMLFSEEATGIYSFAYTIAMIIDILWLSFNSAWVPHYYTEMKLDNVDRINKEAKNYIWMFTLVCSAFMLGSPDAVRILAPASYHQGVFIMPLVVMGYYFVYLYSFPVNYQFYKMKTKWIALGTTSAALVNIVLNWLLIPGMGMFGAAIATLISYILLFLFHTIIARYIIKGYHYSIKLFFNGIGFVTVCCLATYLLIDMWPIRWVFAIAIATIAIRRIMKNKSFF